MEWFDIAKMPTIISTGDMRGYIDGTGGVHESILRSWSIVQEVKTLLEKKVDPEVILKIIKVMEQVSQPEERS